MLKRLAEAHPSSVAKLSHQYRMNKDICALSNEIVYAGSLKCADDVVGGRRLDLPGYPENLPPSVLHDPWLSATLNPAIPVVFIDTDRLCTESDNDTLHCLERLTGRAGGGGGSVMNDTEASIVQKVVGGLLMCGLTSSSIGVICPFRAQVRFSCSSVLSLLALDGQLSLLLFQLRLLDE